MSDTNIQNKSIYIKSVELENYGPCKNVKYNFRFDENGNPVPLVLIGKNGGGKTIFLAHIINAMLVAKQMIYDNCEVEKGTVYKLRHPGYISTGALYSRSEVEFTEDNAKVIEWQLINEKEMLIKNHGLNLTSVGWAEISGSEANLFKHSFNDVFVRKLIDHSCIQYFPSNRFEEPAWLNSHNLTSHVEYMDLNRLATVSNRSMISVSTLKESQKWFLGVLLDRCALELQMKVTTLPVQTSDADGNLKVLNMSLREMLGYRGQATQIYDEILKLLNQLFNVPSGTMRFGLGHRYLRQLSIIKNEQVWIPSLFQLSSGEILLLDLFLCIIKDFDLSKSTFTQLSDINGIVLIDEIDLHLHIQLQKDILPKLIKLFPKIQFVITTHSPMFLLGMQKEFGTNGFDILDMPSAEPVSVEDFSEFQDLFSIIRETKTYTDTLNATLKESQLPAIFVEGDYDIQYITKTIELFYKEQDLFSRFRLFDGGGFGNLNKIKDIDSIWNLIDSKSADALSVKMLLLYDCDIKRDNSSRGMVTRTVIPTNSVNPISKGIENLLPDVTIQKLEAANPRFIDVTPAMTKRTRGEVENVPEVKEINKDEKKNVCKWLCENGDESDFEGFKVVVDIILEFLSN